jgi:hypothetical protein
MKEPMNARRQFFRSMLRNVSLALLGTAGGVAAVKRGRLMREGKCLNRGICSGCGIFDDCGLPRALSVKRAFARTPDGR